MFTLPKVLRVFIRRDKGLHGEIPLSCGTACIAPEMRNVVDDKPFDEIAEHPRSAVDAES